MDYPIIYHRVYESRTFAYLLILLCSLSLYATLCWNSLKIDQFIPWAWCLGQRVLDDIVFSGLDFLSLSHHRREITEYSSATQARLQVIKSSCETCT